MSFPPPFGFSSSSSSSSSSTSSFTPLRLGFTLLPDFSSLSIGIEYLDPDRTKRLKLLPVPLSPSSSSDPKSLSIFISNYLLSPTSPIISSSSPYKNDKLQTFFANFTKTSKLLEAVTRTWNEVMKEKEMRKEKEQEKESPLPLSTVPLEITPATLNTVNLNKVSADQLKAVKEVMNVEFLSHQLKPGEEGYSWDKRIEFDGPKEESDWD